MAKQLFSHKLDSFTSLEMFMLPVSGLALTEVFVTVKLAQDINEAKALFSFLITILQLAPNVKHKILPMIQLFYSAVNSKITKLDKMFLSDINLRTNVYYNPGIKTKMHN